jgi:type I restriction enzyme S subunit
MNAKVVLKHFNRISTAPDAVCSLRQFILDLAMRGKLVEQDPSDEPASVMVKRIELEKTNTAQLGEFRPKQLNIINDDQIGFELPAGWCSARLGHISRRIQYGFTASADRSVTDVRLLRITDIQNNSVDWDGVPGCDISASEASQYQLGGGDILIARTGGTIGKSFLIRDMPVSAVFASYLIRIQASSEIFDRYLKLYLESPIYWKQLREGSRGTGQPNVNGQTLGQLVVVVPPRREQERIVAKCDELMALCDRLEEAERLCDARRDQLTSATLKDLRGITSQEALRESARFFINHLPKLIVRPAHIKQIRQTILDLAIKGQLVPQDSGDEVASVLLQCIVARKASLIGEAKIRRTKACRLLDPSNVPHHIPESWTWAMLGDITDIGTGSTPTRTQLSFWNGGTIPWTTSGSTSQGIITSSDEHVTEAAVKAHRLRLYQPGTLLVALYGQGKTRGQVATLGIASTINQACAAVCPLQGYESVQLYLKLLLLKNYDEVRLLSAGGTQPNLNVQKIKEILVPLPPLVEQNRIVAKVEELMALCDRLEVQLTAARTLSRNLVDAVLSEALSFAATSSKEMPYDLSAVDKFSAEASEVTL